MLFKIGSMSLIIYIHILISFLPANNFTAGIYDNLKSKDTGDNSTLKPKA
jgi:hypothetical protein